MNSLFVRVASILGISLTSLAVFFNEYFTEKIVVALIGAGATILVTVLTNWKNSFKKDIDSYMLNSSNKLEKNIEVYLTEWKNDIEHIVFSLNEIIADQKLVREELEEYRNCHKSREAYKKFKLDFLKELDLIWEETRPQFPKDEKLIVFLNMMFESFKDLMIYCIDYDLRKLDIEVLVTRGFNEKEKLLTSAGLNRDSRFEAILREVTDDNNRNYMEQMGVLLRDTCISTEEFQIKFKIYSINYVKEAFKLVKKGWEMYEDEKLKLRKEYGFR